MQISKHDDDNKKDGNYDKKRYSNYIIRPDGKEILELQDWTR